MIRPLRARCCTATAALVASVMVGAVLIGHIGRSIHFAQVQHARCAEHGEPLHVEGRGEQGARAQSRTAHERLEQTPAAGAHAHDHCQLATYDRQRGATVAAGAALTGPLASVESPAGAPSSSCDGHRALYRLAPKASPPA